MLKRAVRYTFFVAVYLSGILIGGIYTPQLIDYAKQLNMEAEQQQDLQEPEKPSSLKKKKYKSKQMA